MAVFRNLSEEEQENLGLSNLDVLLSTRASEETLLTVLNQVAKDNNLEQILNALENLNSNNQDYSNETLELSKLNSNTNDVYLKAILEQLVIQNNLIKLILS